MTLQALPVLLPFFTFAQIKFRYQLLDTLQRDRFAIVIVIANDVLLVLGKLGH